MKQETKELIDWIKKQISISGTVVTNISQSNWQKDKEKAVKFLDSLKDIELRLCLGGYIQDRNDTPCCHGDTVKIFTPDGRPADTGTLCWNATNHQFYIMDRPFGTSLWGFSKEQIEKIEK